MTRVKTVFDTRQCAHVWAQQTQEVGRNASSSVSFEGATFYSYQTPIATIVEATAMKGAERMRVALVNGDYTITTKGKHLPAVRRALHDLMPVFDVPFVYPHARGRYRLPFTAYGNEAQTWRAVHEANCAALNEAYSKQVSSFMRARTWFGSDESVRDHVRGYLTDVANHAERYARLFDIPSPNFPIEADTARIIERRQRIESDPKRAAKAAAREAAKKRTRLEQAKRAAETNAERIAKFRAGEQVGYVSDASGCAMLRVSADGSEIETSWGARAPLSHVCRALAFYKIAIRPWTRETTKNYQNPVTTLGAFQLDAIDADGNVRAGCHRITALEVERLRAALEGPDARM